MGYNNLAVLYEEVGEYNRALDNYFKALKIDEEIFGERHTVTQNSYKNIALLYYTMGKYQEAQKYAKLAQNVEAGIKLEPILIEER